MIYSLRLFLVLLATVLPASAANWYVRYPNGGTGTSWANAAPGFWALTSVAPGDTIWLAGGTEFQGNIAWSGTSGNPISIKRARATESACTSSPGWNAAYDSQVVINVPYVQGAPQPGYQCWQNWIVIDGMVANGIKFVFSTPTNDWANETSTKQMGVWGGGSNCSVSNVEFQGSVTPNNQEAIDWGDFNRFGQLNHVTLSRLNIHGCSNGFQVGDIDFLTVEFCEISVLNGNTANHDNGSYTFGNLGWGIWRYNYMHDFSSFGFALIASLIGQAKPHDWKIYGNVWQNTARPGSGQALVFDNACADAPCQLPASFEVYNNTFVNVGIGVRAESRWPTQFPNSSVAGGQFKNNIIYNAPYSGGFLTHDYNWVNQPTLYGYGTEPNGVFNGTDPFINLAAGDFHINTTVSSTMPRNKGLTLASEFNTDRDGHTRGADGTWDIGAYEAITGGTIPGTLQFSASAYSVSEGAGTVTITVTRTGGSDGTVGASYATSNGSATAGSDYTSASSTVSLGNGVTSANFQITITDDASVEGTETFTINLNTPTGGASLGSPTTTTVSITDNDSAPTIPTFTSFPFNASDTLITAPMANNGGWVYQTIETDPTNSAGHMQFKFVVPSTGNYRIDCNVDAPTGGNNSFFVAVNGTNDVWDIIPFASSEVRSVNYRGSGAFDAPQYQPMVWPFTAGVTNYGVIFGREANTKIQTISLVEVSPPPATATLYFAQYPYTVFQSGSLTTTVYRATSSSGSVSVDYYTQDGTAVAGLDYVSTNGTLSFGNNVTNMDIIVSVTNRFSTNDLSFSIILTNPVTATLTSPSNTLVNIPGTPPPPVITNTLTIMSQNPSSGVAITVSPNDTAGLNNGNTTFVRNYIQGASVDLTAPATVGANTFNRWEKNSATYSTSPSITVGLVNNTAMTAVYTSPTVYTITVNSSNPSSGVNINVSPQDNSANGSGLTGFTRSYNSGTSVTLTAPGSTGSNTFVQWLKNGITYTTSIVATFTVTADATYTAQYASPAPVTSGDVIIHNAVIYNAKIK